MIVVVDSDGLIGSFYPQDAHFGLAAKVRSKLAKADAKLIYPATVVVETVTVLQGRLNEPKLAQSIIDLVTDQNLYIENVDGKILEAASSFWDFKASKHNTFFDAVVLAIAKKYNADAIFSFDKFYQKRGFKLASELQK